MALAALAWAGPPVELAVERSSLRSDRLEAFIARSREERSTALIVMVDGSVVFAEGDLERPSIAMSMSKSVTALVIGALVDQGHLQLDEALSAKLLPEWRDPKRSQITLRHLMTHSAGMPRARWLDGVPGGIAELAFDLVPDAPVGERFLYNNAMCDLLAVIAQRAHPRHLPLDDQFTIGFATPMGMVGDWWMKDPHGVPRAAGELVLRPIDAVKIGTLVLDGGMWEGRRLLSEAWVQSMLGPSTVTDGYGLLWWRNRSADGTQLVRADGYLGQFLAVVPEHRLVVLRMRDPTVVPVDGDVASWKTYPNDVFTLLGRPPEPSRQPSP